MGDFSILSDFEIARSIAAIEVVGRGAKPVAEVGNVKASDSKVRQLQDDLRRCLSLASEHGVRGFLRREEGGRWSYGFYRHPWVLDALEFLRDQGVGLTEYHRDWISGLLFGYGVEAIQRFLTAESASLGSMSQHGCDADTAGISRPGSGRSHTRSPKNGRYLIVH